MPIRLAAQRLQFCFHLLATPCKRKIRRITLHFFCRSQRYVINAEYRTSKGNGGVPVRQTFSCSVFRGFLPWEKNSHSELRGRME
jgi:hypothetical protein